MATKGQELAEQEPSNYLAVLPELGEVAELIKENLGSEGFDVFTLNRIKIPAGGGLAWTVETLTGPEAEPEIRGIIIAWQHWQVYYSKPLEETGGGSPPDCSSRDGQMGTLSEAYNSEGIGMFGPCASCPNNQWGTGRNGRGKACKEVRALFLLREGDTFPTLLTMPPTSIKPIKTYMLNLANKRQRYYGIETALKLEQRKGNGTPNYSAALPRMTRVLTPEELKFINDYRPQIMPVLEAVPIVQDDVRAATDPDDLPFE